MKILEYRVFCEIDNRHETFLKKDDEAAIEACPVDTGHVVTPGSLAVYQVYDQDIKPYRQVLGEDNQSMHPVGLRFTADAGVRSVHDKEFEEKLNIRGGVMFSGNANLGDWIEVLIIDALGVLGIPAGLPEEVWEQVGFRGYTEEGYPILAQYVPEWFVMPGEKNELIDGSIGKLPAPHLVARLVYHSTGNEDVEGVMNFISYKENEEE